MPDLKLERTFNADAKTVFGFVTETEHLLNWWGPEGMHVPEHDLDLTRLGPWHSVMVNADGGRYKVSGEVIEYDPPNGVSFTWAWHDEDDQRGNDTTVHFKVTPKNDGGSQFVLLHEGLADDESVANHNTGWTSSFKKLERLDS